MIPLAVPNLSGREREYLNQCIDSTFISSVGEFVDRFESVVAEKCNSRRAVAVSSGTTGLHLALIGHGIGHGDLVIIPSFTFIATANAVAHCGAEPWIFDVTEDSWTIDVAQIENEINKECKAVNGELVHVKSGKRVAAIMPVYTLGNIPDMDKLTAVGEKYGIPVISDAACALGAEYKGKKIGKLSDCSVLSFNGNKTITSGGGGMILVNDDVMADRLKHLSTTARVNAEYDFDMIGYNYRMTNLQAAVGCAQMERADAFVEKKRKIRDFYNKEFGGLPGITRFPVPQNQKSACWFSGIVLSTGGLEVLRIIVKKLKERGIESRSFWKPIHLQTPYEDTVMAESLKVSEGIWDRILTLPCSTGITDEELIKVSEAVKEVL